MTTLTDRPSTGLLVIDMQNDVVRDSPNRDAVVANIATLVDRARREGIVVVWIQHHDEGLVPDSDGWQYVPELVRMENEPLVHKSYGDSFESTTLETVLADHAIGHLVVAGAQTDACVRSTLHGAFTRGYDVTLVSDAHTTEDLTEYGAPPPDQVITHTNLDWGFQSAPGRTASTAATAEIEFGPAVAG
ncbi:MAG: isochorismatase family protein [Acidimicrobiales bacterium]